MSIVYPCRHIATQCLHHLGNPNPTPKQIRLLESLIEQVPISHRLSFDKRLNHQETACLYWAAQGKTQKETADILAIKPTMVKTYRRTICEKLACSSITHAVYKGLLLGYLHFSPT